MHSLRTKWVRRRSERSKEDFIKAHRNANVEDLSRIDECIFCFAGEFGYELIGWIPYLKYISHKYGRPLRTCSRPGSKIFYPFSAEHIELDFPTTLQRLSWGSVDEYRYISELLGSKKLIFPMNEIVGEQSIRVGQDAWNVRDIHREIPRDCYAKLDFSHLQTSPPEGIQRPYVVINNKNYFQWYQTKLINAFLEDDLVQLRDFFVSKGIGVVYNPYFETGRGDTFDISDEDIFGKDERTISLSERTAKLQANERNLLQISAFMNAEFVLSPQGGSCYIPAICGKNQIVLMRRGDYTDYLELANIYSTKIEVFYETRHIMEWMRNRLSDLLSA